MNYFLWVLLLSITLYLGVCLFYYFFQTRLIFVRFDIKGKYRFRLTQEHEEILLKSKEGETLHGLWMKTKKPKGLLLYFHGNTGSLKRWGKIASKFTDFGYDVLAPDYRGYGKSTGRPSEKNLIEDAEVFYSFALKHYKESDIVIYGRSLGSGVATQLAAKENPKLVMLETPFASLLDVVSTILPFIPFKILLKHTFLSIDHIAKIKSPIIIMAGTKDTQVPYRSSIKLYNKVASREDVHFYSFDKGEHNTLSSFKKYRRIMEKYLT
jgi:fermentation-respiration switch protein FrsA (DUF1100 family)